MTMHPIVERRLLITLSVLCIAEAAVAVTPWLADPSRLFAGPDTGRGANAVTVAAPLAEAQPLESFASFIARPLFTASRRPPPVATASRGESAAPFQQGRVILGRYRLTGVVVTPKVRIAFVTDINTNKSIAVSEGEKLGDWVFTEITRDSITVQSEGRSNTIAFRAPPEPAAVGR